MTEDVVDQVADRTAIRRAREALPADLTGSQEELRDAADALAAAWRVLNRAQHRAAGLADLTLLQTAQKNAQASLDELRQTLSGVPSTVAGMHDLQINAIRELCRSLDWRLRRVKVRRDAARTEGVPE